LIDMTPQTSKPSQTKSRRLILMTLVVFAVLNSLISLKYFAVPYLWIGLSWISVTVYYLLTTSIYSLQALCLNFSVVMMVLTSYEAFMWAKAEPHKGTRYEDIYDNYYHHKHDILGYGPIKGITKPSAKKYFKDQLLYDVTYTIEKNGLRKSMPTSCSDQHSGCLLFFGGSGIFGEGVNDHEAMPYQVGIMSHEKYCIYNFGFHGYGPHQMLSALEHKLVEDIVDCGGPKIAIYQAALFHIHRAAGFSSWDKHGPKYMLGENGEPVFAGHFDGKKGWRSFPLLNKSLAWQKLFSTKRAIRKSDVDLFIGIINKSKECSEKLYPGSRFYVILWDSKWHKYNKKVIDDLRQKGISVHLISEILPDRARNKSQYRIPHDGHPNAFAHKMIARYVVDHIL